MVSPEEVAADSDTGPLMRQLVLAYLREEGVGAAQAGQRQRAEGYLQQALTLDDADADLWALLGAVAEGPVRTACARQALALDPGHAQARALLAEAIPVQESAFRLPTPHLHLDSWPVVPRRRRRPGRLDRPLSVTIRLPRPAVPAFPQLSRRAQGRIFAILALVLVLIANLTLGSAYVHKYEDRFFPGVRIAGLDVGGMTPPEARDLLQAQVSPFLRWPVMLRYGEQTWSFTAGQIGLHYRIEEATAAAWELGRRASPFSSWSERVRLGLWGKEVPLLADVQAELLETVLDQVAAALDLPAIPPAVSWQDGGWAIIPGQDGRQVVRVEVGERLVAALTALVYGDTPPPGTALVVAVPMVTETAALSEAELVRLHRQLDWAGQPLELRCGEYTWAPGPTDIASWLKIDLGPPPNPPSVHVNQDELRAYLTGLAADVAVPMQRPRMEIQDGRVVTFEMGRDGRELDISDALSQVEGAVWRRLGGEEVDTVHLTTTVVPAGNDAAMAELGVVELIGEGHSSFAGSPENRVTNIVVGGRELHGRLIAPDEVFSLNDALNPVTGEKGYVMSEIIAGGTVGWGLGGGLCQIATTLYRAAIYSGLEIVDRTPHLWRLDWYEQDSPPGFDATIMIGGPDLKIRNNTGHYILIQVETDAAERWQVVRFYGTSPGWRVSISDPVIYDGGHSVSFERTVTKDGQVLSQETFYSSYQ